MPIEADATIKVALEAGGVVGGASALASYGVWVTALPRPQIATPPNKGVRSVTTGDRIWEPCTLDDLPWRVSILDALVQHARRVDTVDAIASIDSAWHQGLIDESGVEHLFRRLPKRCARWRRLLDPKAESGLESLVRVPCLARGWTVESQVPAPSGGRSDLLIDDWLYVETDGDEWHDNARQAAKDRRRNRAAIDEDSVELRFGYADVVHGIELTMASIARVLAAGRPRRAAS